MSFSTSIDKLGRYRLVLVATLALAFSTSAAAQRAAFAAPARSIAPPRAANHAFNSRSANFALGRGAHSSGFRHSSPYPYAYASLPFPFFGDSFDPNDVYSTGYPVASQPPPFVLEAARALANSSSSMGFAPALDSTHVSDSSQPLMVELQNGQYVRVNTNAAEVDDAHDLTFAASGKAPNKNTQPAKSARNHSSPLAEPTAALGITASRSRELPPATLIFRDGHSEEVRDYTIADGILYARGDYYADGYWNKKIALSTLDVAQTLQANATRSVNFVLPSSPNEVITRP
ncbi:MAG: hypothetical protein WAN65_28820 [Candidatus Sulfotelmatobacter sp.]